MVEAPEIADETLAGRAHRGDEAAFEQIFERHRRRVARITSRFFGRQEKIEEIVQEVFTKIYFGLADYSSERGASFSAWVSRITINSCYDQLRRARRRPESAFGDLDGDETAWLAARLHAKSPGGDAESHVISRDLAGKLLARLEPQDRLVLTLLEAEGQSIAEIAALVGWSAAKVKVRAHRARLSLRRVLKEFI